MQILTTYPQARSWLKIPLNDYKKPNVKLKIKRKEYLRTRKLLEIKLYNRNVIWAVPLVRYSGPFLKWTREELQQTGSENKKINNDA